MPNFNNLCRVSGNENNCLLHSIALGLLEQQGSAGFPYLLENEAFRRAFTTHYKLNQRRLDYTASAREIAARLQQCNNSFEIQNLLGPVLRSMLNGEAARADREACMLAFGSFLGKVHEYFLAHDGPRDNANDDEDDFTRFKKHLTTNENHDLARYMSSEDYMDLKNLYVMHRAANDNLLDLTDHFVKSCKENAELVRLFDTKLYQPYCERIAKSGVMLEPSDVQVLLNTFNLKLHVYSGDGTSGYSEYEGETRSDNLVDQRITIDVLFSRNDMHYEYFARSPEFKQSLERNSPANLFQNVANDMSTEVPQPGSTAQIREILLRKLNAQNKAELTKQNLEEILNPSTNHSGDSETKNLQEGFDAIFARHVERLQRNIVDDDKELDEKAFEATLNELGMIHR